MSCGAGEGWAWIFINTHSPLLGFRCQVLDRFWRSLSRSNSVGLFIRWPLWEVGPLDYVLMVSCHSCCSLVSLLHKIFGGRAGFWWEWCTFVVVKGVVVVVIVWLQCSYSCHCYFSEALAVAGLQLIPMGVAGTIRPVDSPQLPTPKFFSPDIESR